MTVSKRPASPPCVSGAATPWPSAWRCSDAGSDCRRVRSLARRSARARRAAWRRPRCDRGPDRDPAAGHSGAHDVAAVGRAARGRAVGAESRRGLAQLAILTGSGSGAVRLGTLPFLAGDLAKLVIAVLLLGPTIRPVRTRL